MAEKSGEDVVAPAPSPPSHHEKTDRDHDNDHTPKLSAAFIQDAKAASDKEQQMTLLQGVRLYPKAIAWSMLISTCIVMEGYVLKSFLPPSSCFRTLSLRRDTLRRYDISLVSNFFAFPQFNQKFGELQPDGSYEISAAWQAGLTNGVAVGEIIGLFINGYVSERFGYRWTVITSLVCLTGFITIFFTAQNVQTLLVAEILCGLPWGVFQTLTITYASEVCPIALRGHLTTYVNFCCTFFFSLFFFFWSFLYFLLRKFN